MTMARGTRAPRRLTVLALAAAMLAAGPIQAQTTDGILRSLADYDRATPDASGRVSVIVELKAPDRAVPQSAGDRSGWVNLNDYIARLQTEALDEFGWLNFNDVIRLKTVPMVAKSVTPAELETVLRSDKVARVHENIVHRISLVDTSPALGVPHTTARGGGDGAVVAVLDTGVEASHPFLAGRVVTEACFRQDGTCPNGGRKMVGPGAAKPYDCDNGCAHGTHVAGIVAGRADGGTGVAPNAKIIAVQVFTLDANGLGASLLNTLQALEWLYLDRERLGVSAVNMSLGGGRHKAPCVNGARRQIVERLRQAGIATIVATGNESHADSVGAPACLPDAISVGSLEKDGTVSEFSNSYGAMTIMAPGGRIVSSVLNGMYAASSGTSMATPQVAGAWAVLKGAHPTASFDQILAALTQDASMVRDPRNGLSFPTLKVDAALARLDRTMGRAAPKPTPPKPAPAPQKPEPQKPAPQKPEPAPKPPAPKPPAPKKEERIDGILIEREDTGPRR